MFQCNPGVGLRSFFELVHNGPKKVRKFIFHFWSKNSFEEERSVKKNENVTSPRVKSKGRK